MDFEFRIKAETEYLIFDASGDVYECFYWNKSVKIYQPIRSEICVITISRNCP